MGELELKTIAGLAGGSIVTLISLALVAMKFLRVYSRDQVSNAKDGAESNLYETLNEQIASLSKRLEISQNESSHMMVELTQLRQRVVSLEGHEEANKNLIKKLDEKDKIIEAQREEVREAYRKLDQVQRERRDYRSRLSKYETTTTNFGALTETKSEPKEPEELIEGLPILMAEDRIGAKVTLSSNRPVVIKDK